LRGGSQFLSINLGGKVASKDWGDSNWSHLFRLLAIKYAHLGAVFIGSTDEFDRSDKLAANWVGPSVNLCGRVSPRESAAAMRKSVVFVGHDSGPMHLAAAVGVPCICVFGGFNRPRTWHPMGEGHRIIHNMAGVCEIRPEDVYAAAQSVIPGRILGANEGRDLPHHDDCGVAQARVTVKTGR